MRFKQAKRVVINLHIIFQLYPFKKNPCVIPGNPKYRFHASDFKTEAMMFGFFILLAFSLQDLFANGFWNIYNRKWNSLKALYTEKIIYDKVINVNYDYEEKGVSYIGTGALIDANLENALLFNNGFVSIRSDNKINKLTPVRTQNKIAFHEIYFSEITLDSLMRIIKDKPITALSIRSNLPIEFAKDNRPQSSLAVDLQNIYNPILKGNSVDSVDINIQKDVMVAEEEMNILQSKIADQLQAEEMFQTQKREARHIYDSIYQSLQSPDLATKEKAIKDLQSAKSHLAQYQNHTFNPTNTLKIAREKLSFLKSKQRIFKQQTVSGFIEFFTIK
jgi:inner membrane protein